MSRKTTVTILFLLVIAIAVFFRFYKLDAVPPGLYPDVAVNGTDAVQALRSGDYKLYYPENNGREGLFINLIALSFWLFGASAWAIKIVPAFFGVLTVVGVYLLTKQLFSRGVIASPASAGRSNPAENSDVDIRTGSPRRPATAGLLAMTPNCPFGLTASDAIALLSTFFLAISFWHVNFSRLGFRAIMVPFFLVWSIYFLLKAIRIYDPPTGGPNIPNKNSPSIPLSVKGEENSPPYRRRGWGRIFYCNFLFIIPKAPRWRK